MNRARECAWRTWLRFLGRVPPGEKRSLDVDDEEQQKKQCTCERSELHLSLPPPLPDDGDEILWCEHVEHDNEVLSERTAEIGGLQEVTTEPLLQGATRKRKGNEKGSNAHEKSLIWAAKDTEWKTLEEKGCCSHSDRSKCRESKGTFRRSFHSKSFCCDASWARRVQGSMVSARVSGS